MFNILNDWVLPISIVATFVVTLLFSTRIKDLLQGIPGDLRKGLNAAEAATIAKVKAAQTDVIRSVTPEPAPVVKPPAPPAA